MSRKFNQPFKTTKFAVNSQGELIYTGINKSLDVALFSKVEEVWSTNKMAFTYCNSKMSSAFIKCFMNHI